MSIEPCCQDCFWETKPNNTDYTQGFRNGVTYATKIADEVLFWAELDGTITRDVIMTELERRLRVEP
ncbi:MAG: hypothetical protein ACKOQ8_07720 [Micrococcales bacterium]